VDQQTFEDALRLHMRREPCQPFVIEMLDRRVLFIDQPRMAFNGGAAAFFLADDDAVLFTCEEVSQIRAAAAQEIRS
jgi:hypothetical protein